MPISVGQSMNVSDVALADSPGKPVSTIVPLVPIASGSSVVLPKLAVVWNTCTDGPAQVRAVTVKSGKLV